MTYVHPALLPLNEVKSPLVFQYLPGPGEQLCVFHVAA